MEQTTELNIFQAFTGPPEWFTGDYIEKALQEAERDPSLKVNPILIELELESHLLSQFL